MRECDLKIVATKVRVRSARIFIRSLPLPLSLLIKKFSSRIDREKDEEEEEEAAALRNFPNLQSGCHEMTIDGVSSVFLRGL